MGKASLLAALFCVLSLVVLAATVTTGTETGHTPLVMLGMVILAAGVVLLRRPAVVPNP